MHIIITDSGVGGLSVFAYAERFLRTHGSENPVKLTYVNASPENDFGYNSMGSRKEKLENFDRFLQIVSNTYSPDSIYVACNTLAVLFPDTRFSKTGRVPVRGIVETGVNRLLRELEQFPRSIATIFGTVTTIEEQTYPTLLQHNGIHEGRIISQACPSLADTISEDRQGMRTKEKIEKYVAVAIGKVQERTTSYLAYLACTHYGYRKEQFSSAFEGHGVDVMVLNPNELVIDDLFGEHKRKRTEMQRENDVEVEFVTRYKIPETALETIAFFLDEVSPKTVQAFTNYTHAPDLF
jgi:glutamate racemase